MKVFTENFNGILDGLIDKLKANDQFTDNYHEADLFVLWQDIRGDCQRLARIVRRELKKPLIVIQHGRGATRDYCSPNNFELLADKICVWGEVERQRLLTAGISSDRIEVVGCPLFSHLEKRDTKRMGKNILFVPIIAEKEEPENIIVYAALKRWECTQLIKSISDKFGKLKRGWATEENTLKEVIHEDGTKEQKLWKKEIVRKLARNITYEYGLLNVKLTPVHDHAQYLSPSCITTPNSKDHIKETAEILKNTDVMVCLEEGTMQLLACALDIPIILVDIFKYGTYGGTENYDRVEKIATKACYQTRKINTLENLLTHALQHPAELRSHRISVCESEGGAHLGDADANIIKVIESFASVAA